MCYRCSICETVSRPGENLKRHAIYRPNGQIARELATCEPCNKILREGVPLEVLQRQKGKAYQPSPILEEAIKKEPRPFIPPTPPPVYRPAVLGKSAIRKLS